MEYQQLLQERRALFPTNMSLTYTQPLNFVRGEKQFLYSHDGKQYLDAYNNVPHVGHCHPRLAKVAFHNLSTLNTNTRYLHENIVKLGKKLTSLFDPKLKVCVFLNSGSEANDLALRMAKIHSKKKGIICMEYAYHGALTSLVPISEYKYRGDPSYHEPHIKIASLPHTYQHPERTNEFLKYELQKQIDQLNKDGFGVGTFIHESFPSCAGQIHLPEGYLKMMYEEVRKNGGVCIADEVQTGFGRLGDCWWAFQQQGVVPDIVTLGKPFGNGYPLSAVVCTEEVARSFDNGMEFFNTCAGSQVATAIGLEVINIIEEEKLMHNAQQIGGYMKQQLIKLMDKYQIIGDVRGQGFMLGVELVLDKKSKKPATLQAQQVIDEMKDNFVLVSYDGRENNVIKIRPNMQFTKENAQKLLMEFENAIRKCGLQASKL